MLGLRRGPGQDAYLGSMEDIFLEAEQEARAKPRQWAVHDAGGGRLVGFVMISDNIPEPIDEDLVGPYFLWKLLVDVDEQGRLRCGHHRRGRGLPADPARRGHAVHELLALDLADG